jgi:hypothetical protein
MYLSGGRTYGPLYRYYMPVGYYSAIGYYSSLYLMVYYNGYGYNFYYGAYGYYENSTTDERNWDPTGAIIIGVLMAICTCYCCYHFCKSDEEHVRDEKLEKQAWDSNSSYSSEEREVRHESTTTTTTTMN